MTLSDERIVCEWACVCVCVCVCVCCRTAVTPAAWSNVAIECLWHRFEFDTPAPATRPLQRRRPASNKCANWSPGGVMFMWCADATTHVTRSCHISISASSAHVAVAARAMTTRPTAECVLYIVSFNSTFNYVYFTISGNKARRWKKRKMQKHTHMQYVTILLILFVTLQCIDHSASEMTYIVSGGALNSTHLRIVLNCWLLGSCMHCAPLPYGTARTAQVRHNRLYDADRPTCVTFYTEMITVQRREKKRRLYDASTWRRRRRRRKKEESRRTFNKKSCDLLTAITHTEIPCALYKTNKQFNKKTKLWKQSGRCDDVTTALYTGWPKK